MNHYRKITPLAAALVLALHGTATSAQGLMLEEIIITAAEAVGVDTGYSVYV